MTREMKTILAFGTFDILHPGHTKFLSAARRLGSHLVVVVARDERVRAEKGHLPIMDERERRALVACLKPVDRAILGDRVGEWRVVRRLRPDTIAIGYDQKLPPRGRMSNVKCKIVRLPRFAAHRHTSSLIKRRITKMSYPAVSAVVN